LEDKNKGKMGAPKKIGGATICVSLPWGRKPTRGYVGRGPMGGGLFKEAPHTKGVFGKNKHLLKPRV